MLHSKEKQKKIIISIIVILFVFFVIILLLNKLFQKEIYKQSDRTSNINSEKKKDNSDKYKTIGWLRVQGTKIDTPIIAYNEKNYFENIEVDKENYLWNEISKEKLYNKVNIMGHNILNLSSHPDSGLKQFTRFDDLMSFIYYDFVEENKYIQYTVDNKNYIYKIYAVNFEYQTNLDLYLEGNYTKEKLKKYIQKTRKESLFEFNVNTNENDKIISLITCTRIFNTKKKKVFVVNARMVRKNEKLVNYGVKETKNYKKIKKIMKGDVSNEKI